MMELSLSGQRADRTTPWAVALDYYERQQAAWNAHIETQRAFEHANAGFDFENPTHVRLEKISAEWCSLASDALRALLRVPAPTLQDALLKLKLAIDNEENEGAEDALRDLHRLTGILDHAAGRGDMAIPLIVHRDPSVDEWGTLRGVYLEGREPLIGDVGHALSQHISPTIAGVIAKLRSALYNMTSDPRVEGAVLCEATLASFDAVRREALLKNDYEVECVWMAIASLEALVADPSDCGPTVTGGLFAEFEAAEARCRQSLDSGYAGDEELEARNRDLYALVERVQALPNTHENLAVRARAVCSAVDFTGVVAELTLSELAAHAESNAGELVRDILACLLGQVAT